MVRQSPHALPARVPSPRDRTADPCDDFYQFSCGNWIKTTEIAADKPIAMRSFVDIEDRNLAYEHDVLEKLRTTPGTDAATKSLGAFYGACMSEAAIEKAGLKPIAPMLATITKVKDVKSLSAAIAALHSAGFSMLFSFGPTQDALDARQVIAGLDQGGIGLPDRDYYLKDDAPSKELKAKYETYVAAMLVELGRKPDVAKTEATAIVALETELAKVSKDKVLRRDPKTMYNRIERAGVDGHRRRSLARSLARQRRAPGHAGVQVRVPLQGKREDDPREAVRRLVKRAHAHTGFDA